MTGRVEDAVRRAVSPGVLLATPTGRGVFTVERYTTDGLVLFLGKKEAWTPLPWRAMEGIPEFLRLRGWVAVGDLYSTDSQPGSLDEYLKAFLKRATAGWVAVVLERAGVLTIDRPRSARVKLRSDWQVDSDLDYRATARRVYPSASPGAVRLMAEHVEPLALGVTWEPNVPDAVLVSRDDGTTVLALNANPDDADQRCVVLVWTMARAASMADPNDEAISGHRLYGKGLAEVRWAGVVEGSQLTSELEKQNRAHPQHDPAQFNALAHHVMLLKECTVEVVATAVAAAVLVERSAGPTPKAAMAVISRQGHPLISIAAIIFRMFLLDASSMMFNMQTDRPAADEVVVRLSYDEAFILSEMLDCWYQAGFDQLYEIADRAERRLLDDLCASFEPVVDEVFAADYLDVLAAARRRLVPPEH